MTALFVVIFLNQWKAAEGHLPALIGIGCSALCLILFGSARFMLPSMAAIVAVCLLARNIPYYRARTA